MDEKAGLTDAIRSNVDVLKATKKETGYEKN